MKDNADKIRFKKGRDRGLSTASLSKGLWLSFWSLDVIGLILILLLGIKQVAEIVSSILST